MTLSAKTVPLKDFWSAGSQVQSVLDKRCWLHLPPPFLTVLLTWPFPGLSARDKCGAKFGRYGRASV